VNKGENGENSMSKEDKQEAINLLNSEYGLNLNGSNAEFSNINENGIEWWFTFKRRRLDNDWHLMLRDQHQGILYYFFIEAGTINNPEDTFHVKYREIGELEVKIRVEDENFMDTRNGNVSFQFRPYLRERIVLPHTFNHRRTP
jgi:hypothetical protein